jgi:hypothetical protein
MEGIWGVALNYRRMERKAIVLTSLIWTMISKEIRLKKIVYMQTLLIWAFVLAWSISDISSGVILFGRHWAASGNFTGY